MFYNLLLVRFLFSPRLVSSLGSNKYQLNMGREVNLLFYLEKHEKSFVLRILIFHSTVGYVIVPCSSSQKQCTNGLLKANP
jgi:hypothetical protein